MARNDLSEAYRELVPPSTEFASALVDALSAAQAASALVSEYDGDRSMIETAERLVKSATALRSSMSTLLKEKEAEAKSAD